MFYETNCLFSNPFNQYLDDPLDAGIHDHDHILWPSSLELHDLQGTQPSIPTAIASQLHDALNMGMHACWQTPVCTGMGTPKGFYCSRPQWQWSMHCIGNGDFVVRVNVTDGLNYQGEHEQTFCWKRACWGDNLMPIVHAAFNQTVQAAREDYLNDVVYLPIRFINEENKGKQLTALLPNDIYGFSEHKLGDRIPRFHQPYATHAPHWFGWQECNTRTGKEDAVFSVHNDSDGGFDVECNGWQSELPQYAIWQLYQEEAVDLLRMAELMISELSMPNKYSSARSYRGWKIFADVV